MTTRPIYLPPAAWGARSIGVKAKMRHLPVSFVFLHHTVTVPSNDPVADARFVEDIGVQRFGRLSYSWLFHPDATILEGQGDFRGAHTVDEKGLGPGGSKIKYMNDRAYSFSAIGDFTRLTPSDEMIDSYAWLLSELARQNRLAYGYQILPHNAAKATACPGVMEDYIPAIKARLAKHSVRYDFSNGPLATGVDGVAVGDLQGVLVALGLDVAIDGNFGAKTTSAVAEFQQRTGLAVTGQWTQADADVVGEMFGEDRHLSTNDLPEAPVVTSPTDETDVDRQARYRAGRALEITKRVRNRVEKLEVKSDQHDTRLEAIETAPAPAGISSDDVRTALKEILS